MWKQLDGLWPVVLTSCMLFLVGVTGCGDDEPEGDNESAGGSGQSRDGCILS